MTVSVGIRRTSNSTLVALSGSAEEDVLLRVVDGVEATLDDGSVVFDVSRLVVRDPMTLRRFVGRLHLMRRTARPAIVARRGSIRRSLRRLCGPEMPPLFRSVGDAVDALDRPSAAG